MKKIVMASPKYFNVVYKINPWMHPEKPTNTRFAQEQWERLKTVYGELGVDVSVIDAVEGLPDFVFAANGFFAIDKKAVLARFRYPERQKEADVNKSWLKDNGFEVVDPGQVVYEGEGDTFLIDDKIYQGHGFRSDAAILPIMQKTFQDKQVLGLHLVDERFYHTDTCFFPIDKDLVFYWSKAFDAETEQMIKTQFREAISVTDEEVLNFGLNAIRVGQTIIVNAQSEIFGRRLQSYGFNIRLFDTSEFQKSGGSIKCMSNEVY